MSEDEKSVRGPDGRFLPGKSGNPGGAHKVIYKLSRECQGHGAEAVATILEIMRTSKTAGLRLAAARELLDRGFGKPAQALQVSGADGGPITFAAINAPQPIPREEWIKIYQNNHQLSLPHKSDPN